jgi:hypothetical protein
MPILNAREMQMMVGHIKRGDYHYREKAKALKKLEEFQRTKMNHEYVDKRDDLIPFAQEFTRKVLEEHHGSANYQFNRLFLKEMDRLAREAGI